MKKRTMGIFNQKKRSENLRNLTEKEIQDKLYGVFHNDPSDTVQPQEPAKKTVSPVLPKLTPAPVSTGLFESVRPKPVIAPGEGGPESRQTESVKRSEPARIANWTEGENKTVTDFSRERLESAGRTTRRPVSYPSSTKTAPKRLEIDTHAVRALGKSVWNMLSGVFLRGVGVLLAVVVQLIKTIDFRKPKVQRAGYWAAGFGCLFLLCAGIHYLNVQREVAMKIGKKAVPTAATVQTAKPEKKSAEETDAVSDESGDAQSAAKPREDGKKTPRSLTPKAEENVNYPYVIQVCTYVNQADALKLKEGLDREKIPVFVKDLTRGGGRTYYSVFIGRFETYREAEKKLDEFRNRNISQPFSDAFVRTLE